MAPDKQRPPGHLMRAEIAEQPAVYARVINDQTAAIRAVHQDIQRRGIRFVLLAARGSSDHAALYAKYLAEVQLRLPAGLVSPSTFTVYGSRPDLSHVLFIAVSQSGASPDLVDSLTAARARGAFAVAVTNAPGSPLATAADRHIDIAAGTEASVAATKTYTAELLASTCCSRSSRATSLRCPTRRRPRCRTWQQWSWRRGGTATPTASSRRDAGSPTHQPAKPH